LPIKYVIQVILSICQNSRLYGPPDGVKSVATTVKLFFTRSQLSSYISRFASGYRLLVAMALLLAFSISESFAQTLTLTGALNSSNVSCATLAGYTTLNIGDGTIATTWTINNNLDLSACPSPITIAINGKANLHIEPSYTLSLPTGSNIILNGSGYVTDDISCAASSIIQIGAIKTATCNGHGGGSPLNSFTEINAFGGTGNVSSNSPVCTGNTINLAAIPSIPGYTYLWTGPLGEIYNTQNITLSSATVLMAGPYEVKITNTTGNSVKAATNVTVAPAITNNIGGGTSPICSGSTPALLTGIPTGGNGTFTYLWESSTSSSTTGFSPANGINNSQTYQPGALTQTTWFRRSVTSGCTNISAPIEIIVTPSVGTPVFVLGTTSSRNQGVETITYKAIANNSTGITYTLSPASAGTFIESAAGLAVTYSSLWNGTCTITATATGCGSTESATHTVSANWCYALFTVNGALSCAGVSSIDGSIGTLVGATSGFTPLTGSGPGKVSGSIDPQATPNSVQAAAQVLTAYNDLAAMPCGTELPHPLGVPIELVGDITLSPNVYCSEGAITVKGNITLNGGVNDLFIFKINGALTTDDASKIILSGGADYRNVYWIVYGAVVLNDSKFIGTIINDGAITLNTNAELNGRALSISGAVALTINKITSGCYPLISIPDNKLPTFVPPGDFSECVENLSSVDYDPINKIIIADRPDYYTFSHGNTDLDLNEALFKDDKPLTCTSNIRWEIVFSPAPELVFPYDIVTKDPITGNGQPSDINGSITFPGDGVNFTTVVHHIRWWIKDCDGKESPPQTRTITINPRPKIVKSPL